MNIFRAFLALCLLSVIPASAQQYVIGSPNLATSQVTVGATATLLLAAHPGRSSVAVVNQGSVIVCLGNSSSVTSSTGLCLPPGNTNYVGIVLPYTGALYGIAASSDVVSVAEIF